MKKHEIVELISDEERFFNYLRNKYDSVISIIIDSEYDESKTLDFFITYGSIMNTLSSIHYYKLDIEERIDCFINSVEMLEVMYRKIEGKAK